MSSKGSYPRKGRGNKKQGDGGGEMGGTRTENHPTEKGSLSTHIYNGFLMVPAGRVCFSGPSKAPRRRGESGPAGGGGGDIFIMSRIGMTPHWALLTSLH